MASLSRRIIFCLVLGIATTVAVSWGFALRNIDFEDWNTDVDLKNHPQMPENLAMQHVGGPFTRVAMGVAKFGTSVNGFPSWFENSHLILPDSERPFNRKDWEPVEVVDSYFGWPFYSLRTRHWDALYYGKNDKVADYGGILLIQWAVVLADDPQSIETDPPYQGKLLPLRPIPIGFVLDTILYSIVYFLFFSSIRTIQIISRRHRNLCIHCKYSLQGLNDDGGCPECGWGREKYSSGRS